LAYRGFFLGSEAANRVEFAGRRKYASPSFIFSQTSQGVYGRQMVVFWRTRFYPFKAVAATEDIRCEITYVGF